VHEEYHTCDDLSNWALPLHSWDHDSPRSTSECARAARRWTDGTCWRHQQQAGEHGRPVLTRLRYLESDRQSLGVSLSDVYGDRLQEITRLGGTGGIAHCDGFEHVHPFDDMAEDGVNVIQMRRS